MLLHDRQRSGPVGLVGQVSPPWLAFAVNVIAHAFAASAVGKFDGLPLSKLEYVPLSLLLDMKQSLWSPTFALLLRSRISFASTGRRSSRSCWIPSAAYLAIT